MRLIDHRKATLALASAATAVALLTLAPAAFADGHGHGHGRGHAYGHRDHYAYAPNHVVYRSAPVAYYAAPRCAPRYVAYAPYNVMIVRPTPYIQTSGVSGVIGGQFGPVSISAVFGPRAHYASYQYGCNFCDAHFSTFGGYANHVEHCGYRPSNVNIEVHAWGDNSYGDVAYDDQHDYDGR